MDNSKELTDLSIKNIDRMLEFSYSIIAEHSHGTLTRDNIIAYLQLYTEKEE